MNPRALGRLAALAMAALAVAAWACTVGPVPVDLPRVLRETWNGIGLPSGESDIFWLVRVPRVALAAVAGAALAASGATFQAILRNPLADPYILGVSGGAAFGALLARWVGLDASVGGPVWTATFAFAGAMGTIVLVHSLARRGGKLPAHTLLLTGVMVNALLASQILLMTSLLDPGRYRSVLAWMLGEVVTDPPRRVAFVAVAVGASLLGLWAYGWSLNLLASGETAARSLGVDVDRVKRGAFLLASFATALVVSRVGLIGFVGLVVPHAVRRIWGGDHRFLLPAAMLVGAAFLVASDACARRIHGVEELPVGVVTALVGAPVFLWLLRRSDSAGGAE